jgi:arylsulfatase A-like enzyme
LSVKDQTGQAPIDNTYIVFTSDNGWFHGEHRIRSGKGRPYEEAPRVPLVISGPGVQAGSSTDKLVLNTDYFPTFIDMADTPETPVPVPSYIDGRTLLPVLTGSSSTWTRTAILLEGRAGNDPEIPVDRNYNAIRTINSKYVVYEGGFKELYNLNPAVKQDNPYELTNLYNNSNNTWGDTEPPLTDLARRLDALRGCQAEDDPETPEKETPCQTAEDGP